MAAIGVTLCVANAQAADPQQGSEELARREQLRIAVQGICPVSGEKLGSMGPPIKVVVGEVKEEIFLCCKSCMKGKIDPKHWATIHNNIAAAQGKCPIMKKALPEKVKWTVVDGQLVYVCCPPCIKKIQANPAESLAQVDQYYMAYLKKKSENERQHAMR